MEHFYSNVPKAWISLTADIREENFQATLKSLLKTFYIRDRVAFTWLDYLLFYKVLSLCCFPDVMSAVKHLRKQLLMVLYQINVYLLYCRQRVYNLMIMVYSWNVSYR